jgi:hypothetical protein
MKSFISNKQFDIAVADDAQDEASLHEFKEEINGKMLLTTDVCTQCIGAESSSKLQNKSSFSMLTFLFDDETCVCSV